jgi:CRISPR-associated protein Cas1
MSSDRILLIENPARIAVDHGRLKIARDCEDDVFVAPDDIAVLCLHHHTVSITTQALKALASAGATVFVTDDRHYPCAIMLPLAGNMAAPQRLHQQIQLIDKPLAGELWAQIVRSRLATQARNLRHFELNGALRLERLAEEVKPGDVSNAEAQGAKYYWKHFFGPEFTREKEGAKEDLNARLNYGFAVLRALVARQLAMSGLNPALGLGHHRQDNPFNLADDFTEPFRYLVERHVHNMEDQSGELTSTTKASLLRFMEQEVEMDKQSYRLGSAVAEVIASYCRILERQEGQLRLP